MIKNISNYELENIDYQTDRISKYEEANKAKILIVCEKTLDRIAMRELFVNNKKIRVILITAAVISEFYELGIDYVIEDEDIDLTVNAIITNLDNRHNIISRVQVKEDFNKINIGGIDIRLTPKEMDIYKYLNKNRGNLCRRNEMLVQVLGYHEGADSRVIDVYVKHLRTKLREEGEKIETIRGKGYIYNF